MEYTKQRPEPAKPIIKNEDPPAEKSPIGLIPRTIWEDSSMFDIIDAIGRYRAAKKTVPVEWWTELHNRLSAFLNQPLTIGERPDFASSGHKLAFVSGDELSPCKSQNDLAYRAFFDLVSEEARQLCYAIEELPASEQQTKVSLMASALSHKLIPRK